MTDGFTQLVLALYPFARGFAFVLFDKAGHPFDWAVKEIKEKHKNTKTLDAIRKLIERYEPRVLVIEDVADTGFRRASRIRKLYRALVRLAEKEGVRVYRCRKRSLNEYFGQDTKYEIAKVVAVQLPCIAHRMPPKRRPWTSEDPRQALFDAAALGLTFLAFGRDGA